MNYKKKISIMLGIILCLICCSYAVYAYSNYFNTTKTEDLPTGSVEISSSLDEDTIDTFEDFLQKTVKTDKYSNSDIVQSDPVNLVLTSNIIFSSDVVISRDCNIDLKEYNLNLNGFHLKISHSYYSDVYIFSSSTTTQGQIINLSSQESVIICDLPNGALYLERIDYNGIQSTIENVDATKVCQSALNYAVYKMNYNTYGNYYSNYETNYIKTNCFVCGNTQVENLCIYTLDDLDFIASFYGYKDLKITYLSSDSSCLTPLGNVLKPGDVNLEINVSYQETSVSKTVHVHCLDASNDAILVEASLSVMLAYYEKYATTVDNQKIYEFTSSLSVPMQDSYFGTEYSYAFYKTSENSLVLDESSSYIEEGNDGNYLMNLNSNVTAIEIIVTKGEETIRSEELYVIALASSTIVDNTTIATNIVRSLYGDKIIVYKDTNGISGYTSKELQISVDDYATRGLKSFSYTLINNAADNVYTISSASVLQVNPIGVRLANPEDVLQRVFLQITIDFDESKTTLTPLQVVVNVEIEYQDISSEPGAEGVSSFRPYYTQFNTWINSASKSYTYSDFSFRGTYGSDYPIYSLTPKMYTIAGEEVTGTVKVNHITYPVIIVDGVEIVTIDSVSSPASNYTVSRDLILFSYLVGSTSYTDRDSITTAMAASGNLRCVITMDTDLLPEIDLIVNLEYAYKMQETSQWNTEGDFVSTFTVPGIARFGDQERFADETVYRKVYELYIGTYTTNSYIIVSRLNQAKPELSFNDTTSITSYRGIEIVKNLERLYVQNANVQPEDTVYFGQMSGLLELDLSNNGLSDYPDSANSSLPFPSGDNNQFISNLQSLSKLEVLWLNNNKIYRFSDLSLLPAIKTIYLYDNSFTCTQFTLLATLNTLFTNILNSLYGSEGTLNEATFSMMTSKGVDIYNTLDDNDQPVKYSPPESLDVVIVNMMNLEFQSRLKDGENISRVYETLSSNPSDYNGGKFLATVDVNAPDKIPTQNNPEAVTFGKYGTEEDGKATSFYMRYSYPYQYYVSNTWYEETIYYEVIYEVERY